MPIKPAEIIILSLLAFAMLAVPAAIAYMIFGMLRKELPTTPTPELQEEYSETPEPVVAAPAHSRHRPHRRSRRNMPDLRNRFGRK